MRIDKAGADDVPRGVDHAAGDDSARSMPLVRSAWGGQITNGRYPLAFDADVGTERRAPGTVYDVSAGYQQVEHFGSRLQIRAGWAPTTD
jgi:hypothetical protein